MPPGRGRLPVAARNSADRSPYLAGGGPGAAVQMCPDGTQRAIPFVEQYKRRGQARQADSVDVFTAFAGYSALVHGRAGRGGNRVP